MNILGNNKGRMAFSEVKKRKEQELNLTFSCAYLIRCAWDQFNKINTSVIPQCILGLKSPSLLGVVICLLT